MIVRPYQPGDIGPVTSLVRTALATMDLRADYGGLGVDVHAVGEGELSGTWVAEDDGGDVVGVAFVQADDAGGCELRRLYVAAENAGRGVGTALLDRACEWARGRGIAQVVVDLPVPLQPSAGFFLQRGFTRREGVLKRNT